MRVQDNLVTPLAETKRYVVVFIAGSLSEAQVEMFAIKKILERASVILIDPSLLLRQEEDFQRLSNSLRGRVQVVSVNSFKSLYNALLAAKPDVVFDLTSTHGIGLVKFFLKKMAPFALVQVLGDALPVPSFFCRLVSRISIRRQQAAAGATDHLTVPLLPRVELPPLRSFLFTVQNSLAQRLSPGPDSVVYAGRASLLSLGSRRAITKVQVQHVDFEKIDNSVPHSSKPTAVFIDEALPTSADYAKLGIRPPVALDDYYSGIAKLLRLAETRHQLKFAVCLHPDSVSFIDEIRGHLADFEILVGKTHSALLSANVAMFHKGTTGLTAARLGVQVEAVLLPDHCRVENEQVRAFASVCSAELLTFCGEPVSLNKAALFSKVRFKKHASPADYLGESHTPLRGLFLEFANSLDRKTRRVEPCQLLPVWKQEI